MSELFNLEELAGQLAQRLVGKQQVDPDGNAHRSFTLYEGDVVICLRHGNRGMVETLCWLGNGLNVPYGSKLPSINVSYSRGANVIAREIERRLLPDLRGVLAKAREHKEVSDKYDATVQKTAKEIVRASKGWLVPSHQNHPSRPILCNSDKGKRCIQVDMEGEASVKLELRWLDPETAKKIIRLLYAGMDPASS